MELLTIKEVCKKLKISRAQLFQLTKEGELPKYKIANSPKSIRYKSDEVDQLLKKVETAEQPTADANEEAK
jgi:excisionase family DNA binding protein